MFGQQNLGQRFGLQIYLSPSVALATFHSKEGVSVVVSSFSLNRGFVFSPSPKVIQLFSMLNSTEYEIYHAHKC